MAQARTTRVMTVDNQALIHSGIQHFLDPFADLIVVGEAYNAQDALRLCEHCEPDVILVEIAALGDGWVETLRRLRASRHAPELVVLTTRVEGDLVREALQAGACGYLLKDLQALTLAQAIRSAATGQQVLVPEATYALIRAMRRAGPPALDLSPREQETLNLMARGLSNREIASRMFISTATAKFHIGSIFAKLGVSNRAQAIVRAYEHSLISPSPAAQSVDHGPVQAVVGLLSVARKA
jgi:DNA-binding NarL/FixJ family response regulator